MPACLHVIGSGDISDYKLRYYACPPVVALCYSCKAFSKPARAAQCIMAVGEIIRLKKISWFLKTPDSRHGTFLNIKYDQQFESKITGRFEELVQMHQAFHF